MKKLITVAVAVLAILAFTGCAEPSSVLIPVIKVENKGAAGKVELEARYVSSGRRASRLAEVESEYAAAVDLHAVLIVYLEDSNGDPVPVSVVEGAASFDVSPGTYELNAWFFAWDSSTGNARYGMLDERGPVYISVVEDATQPVSITIGYDSQSGDIGIGIMGHEHSTALMPVTDPSLYPLVDAFGPAGSNDSGCAYTQGTGAGETEYVGYAKEGKVALFMLGLTDEDKDFVRNKVGH